MDNMFWLEGKVSIPKEKRREFNENVLKLFNLCGIRKLKEIELDGKKITVVHEPKPDDKGVVEFDYSIFERKKREISFYDMNTCELHAVDCGYREFAAVMDLVMVMQEAYSTDHCYFMHQNQVCDVCGHALLIERTIGLKLSFTNREKIWDMLLFFKSDGKYNEMTYKDIWDKFPYGYGEVDLEQFLACVISSTGSADKPKDYCQPEKSEIKHARAMQRAYYAYELIQGLIESRGNEEVKVFLKNLLELNIAERERLAQNEDAFGTIAEVSLYELPAYIVAVYGWAVQEEFWEVWFSLGITGYQDIYESGSKNNKPEEKEPEKEKSERKERLFYKIIQRDSEDEFLEFWDEQELFLSDEMRMDMEDWKQEYEETDEVQASDIHVESYLADILLRQQEIWNCRYVDEELVKEFMEHTDDLRFKKALLVFKEIMDWSLEYFPELTEAQVREWVLKRGCSPEDRIELSGYASLLTNRVRRMGLLGF